MKLSEEQTAAIKRCIEKRLPVPISMAQDWRDKTEQLEAKLEAVECGECGKNLLECNMEECDRIADGRP